MHRGAGARNDNARGGTEGPGWGNERRPGCHTRGGCRERAYPKQAGQWAQRAFYDVPQTGQLVRVWLLECFTAAR